MTSGHLSAQSGSAAQPALGLLPESVLPGKIATSIGAQQLPSSREGSAGASVSRLGAVSNGLPRPSGSAAGSLPPGGAAAGPGRPVLQAMPPPPVFGSRPPPPQFGASRPGSSGAPAGSTTGKPAYPDTAPHRGSQLPTSCPPGSGPVGLHKPMQHSNASLHGHSPSTGVNRPPSQPMQGPGNSALPGRRPGLQAVPGHVGGGYPAGQQRPGLSHPAADSSGPHAAQRDQHLHNIALNSNGSSLQAGPENRPGSRKRRAEDELEHHGVPAVNGDTHSSQSDCKIVRVA
ncbi:hypothetical protein V8C86DRAFT_2571359 [Haematococcus lacustris]